MAAVVRVTCARASWSWNLLSEGFLPVGACCTEPQESTRGQRPTIVLAPVVQELATRSGDRKRLCEKTETSLPHQWKFSRVEFQEEETPTSTVLVWE